MTLSPSQEESLVTLLTRIYTDVLALEEEFHLFVGEGDFRPRIEYFHDAVRAFTSDDLQSERLSVELLAYDLACLRYIHVKPLSSFKPHGAILSPSTQVIAPSERTLQVKKARPDRLTKEKIADYYRHYAVLFSALLKPLADRNTHDRVDYLNNDIEDLQTLIKEYAALAKNKGNQTAIGEAITHLDDDTLRNDLQNFMHQQKFKKKENLEKLVQFLKAQASRKNKEITDIESAHMNYALAQLGIFEDSKDMLKKMAKGGMNLVGTFVEASIAQSKRDIGM
jgi:hypothetical protein